MQEQERAGGGRPGANRRSGRGRPGAASPPVTGERPAPLAGEVVQLTITGMAYGGEAVGRADDGTVAFIWGALPGETVEVEITERRRNYWRGQLRQIVTPAPARVTPACPYFGTCGGCQWQYMDYPAQVQAKQAILVDQVRGAYPQVAEVLRPPLAMIEPWHYRNVAHFIGDANGQPAFRRWQSHELVAVRECPISQPAINAALAGYQGGLEPGERLSLRCSADGQQLQVWRGEGGAEPERLLIEQIGGVGYQISPRAFFQVNTRLEARPPLERRPASDSPGEATPTSLAEDLVRLVLEGVAGFTHQTVVDAYCGVGLFAVPLAAQAPRVIGLDESADAIVDAIQNAQQAGRGNALFLLGTAEHLLPAIAEPVSAVVLDPPRIGVDERALQTIIGRGIPRLVYVSCNPSTLGRDLRRLAEGGYKLEWLRLVDLFPQTLHIEAVAVLTLR